VFADEPKPARWAKSRSSNGPVSTYTATACRTAELIHKRGKLLQSFTQDVVVVIKPRVTGY